MLASLAAPQLFSGITTPQQASSEARGWLGRNHLDLTLEQGTDRVEIEGSIGMGSLDATYTRKGSNGELSGEIRTAGGWLDVEVDSKIYDNGRVNYFGYIGDAGVSLSEIPQADGARWIVGNVGGQSVSITRKQTEKGEWFSGTAGQDFAMVSVWVTSAAGAQAPSSDGIVPLMALAR